MGVVENVVAAIILIFLLLVSGLIYLTSFAHNTTFNEGVKLDIFFDDSRINDLGTLMKITEVNSGRPIGVLLADAVFYRNEILQFNNVSFNITNKTSELLEMSFGNNKYYLVIKPRIIEVSLNFIIDGSPSLQDERNILAAEIQNILIRIETKLNETNKGYKKNEGDTLVVASIYILGSKAQKCDIFNALADSKIQCFVLNDKDLYLRNGTINSSDDFINNTRLNIDAFHSYYNMTPPFGFAWIAANVSDYYASPSDYYESDWGYGTGYASNFDLKTTLSKLTLLFPMGDELSTSSIADTCFYEPRYEDWVVCSLCDDTCPVERALNSTKKGIQITLDNNHIINPIFSYKCNYNYQPIFNDMYNLVYGTTTSNACGESNCNGCSLSGPDVCFHPSCQTDILNQMNLMAQQTGGNVINLDEISTMDVNITDTINKNIDQYTLEIGTLNRTLERDVIETSQPLPNGQLVDIRLWVYKN